MEKTIDYTSGFNWTSDATDGASAVAFVFNTANAYATSGAKLASWKNNGTEKCSINKDGMIVNSAFNIALYGSIKVGGAASSSGTYSTAVGYQATSTGYGSTSVGLLANSVLNGVAIGRGADQNAEGGIALGYLSKSDHHFGVAVAGNQFAATADNQLLIWQPAATTTDATPAILYLNESGASARMTLAAGKLYAFEAHVVGIQSDGTDASYFTRKGIIANNSGTTALIGAVQTVGTDIESNASTDVAITADDSNDALQISVTGIAAETWRWSANVFVKDITIGT